MTISTYDIDNFDRDVDERIEEWANLGNNWTRLLTSDGNMVSSAVFDIDSALSPNENLEIQVTLLGVVQRQQDQIDKLRKEMSEIFTMNRKLDDEVFHLKVALRDSFSNITIKRRYWNDK